MRTKLLEEGNPLRRISPGTLRKGPVVIVGSDVRIPPGWTKNESAVALH